MTLSTLKLLTFEQRPVQFLHDRKYVDGPKHVGNFSLCLLETLC